MSTMKVVPLPDKNRKERSSQIIEYLEDTLRLAKEGKLSTVCIHLEKWDGTYEIRMSGCENVPQTVGHLFQAILVRMGVTTRE